MKQRLFDCPMCGNPLPERIKPRMRCNFCETIIVPKSSKLKREEKIYVKEENEEDNK